MSKKRIIEIAPLDVTCPHCHAGKGDPCVWPPVPKVSGGIHKRRVDEAGRQFNEQNAGLIRYKATTTPRS